MNHSNDARHAAMATALHVLVVALRDSGALKPDLFLGHVMSAHRRLVDLGERDAAAAMQDLIEPIANHLGYSGEPSA